MLRANQFVPFELFLTRGEIRHSVGVLYGMDGELMRPQASERSVEASSCPVGSRGTGTIPTTSFQMESSCVVLNVSFQDGLLNSRDLAAG